MPLPGCATIAFQPARPSNVSSRRRTRARLADRGRERELDARHLQAPLSVRECDPRRAGRGAAATARPSTFEVAAHWRPRSRLRARTSRGGEAAFLERRDLGLVEYVERVDAVARDLDLRQVVDGEVAERVRDRLAGAERATPGTGPTGAVRASSQFPQRPRARRGHAAATARVACERPGQIAARGEPAARRRGPRSRRGRAMSRRASRAAARAAHSQGPPRRGRRASAPSPSASALRTLGAAA